jgi:hypothetical protein
MIYAIVIKETGEVLDTRTLKKYWPNYGANELQGWRPPKKTYTKLGFAKTGFAHCPEIIKPDLAIGIFEMTEVVIDGKELDIEQKSRKEKRKLERQKRIYEYRIKLYKDRKHELEEYKTKLAETEKLLEKFKN